jgi:DNA gyrase subunit B
MAKPPTTSYNNESISSLKGEDRVRLRPSVIFGSDGIEGCQHAIFEILSNSIDEARAGYGNKIILTRYLDKSIECEDFGRGCPVDWNPKEERYNWELVFCELYAGGKYMNAEGENYEYSLGLNGLGSCATQYASRYMDVEVYRDENKYNLHFERGRAVGEMQKEEAKRHRTGTRIRFLPDLEVFTDIDIPREYFSDMLKRQAVVNEGVRFVFRDEISPGKFEEEEFYFENGIRDYVKELAGPDRLSEPRYFETERRGRDRPDREEYKLKISFAFCFTRQNSAIEYYHNSSWLEYGGAPDKATRNAFVYALDDYIKREDKYQKNERKLAFTDIEDSLILVTNCFSTMASYENQTKKAVNNSFIQKAMTEFMRENLKIFLIENKAEADRIIEQVLINKRSREEAEKTRLSIRTKLKGTLKFSDRVEKFVDCRSRDVSKRELYIVEGDSALGACKQSRNAEFQGIMPVRGKILNCLKADYSRIFKSDVIMDLMKVLGCGVEVPKRHKGLASFDLDALRWSKIIICTDADVDGFQIRTLILAMFYRLAPTLIREGYTYIAESPLYEISDGKTTHFAYSDSEKNETVQKLGSKRVQVKRSKGLGENDPEMMWLTTMNPETRKLIRVVPEDVKRTAEFFDLLLGDNLAGRKQFISDFGSNYMDLVDVS